MAYWNFSVNSFFARYLAALLVLLTMVSVSPAFSSDADTDSAKSSETTQQLSCLNTKVSVGPSDYNCYPGAPSDKISIQYAVVVILNQAKLDYDFDKSLHDVGVLAQKWITPNIVNTRCSDALHQILDPVGLDYKFVNSKVVLKHAVAKAQ